MIRILIVLLFSLLAHAEPVTQTKKPASVDEIGSLDVIQEILKVLRFEKGTSKEEKFKIFSCDNDPKSWVKRAMRSTSVQKTYSFSNSRCDVSGTFTGTFLEEVPIYFVVHNLKDFKKAKMKARLGIRQKSGATYYRFTVKEGELSGDTVTLAFEANYEVEIDPLTETTKYDTQEGKITLLKFNDKPLSISRPILFER